MNSSRVNFVYGSSKSEVLRLKRWERLSCILFLRRSSNSLYHSHSLARESPLAPTFFNIFFSFRHHLFLFVSLRRQLFSSSWSFVFYTPQFSLEFRARRHRLRQTNANYSKVSRHECASDFMSVSFVGPASFSLSTSQSLVRIISAILKENARETRIGRNRALRSNRAGWIRNKRDMHTTS